MRVSTLSSLGPGTFGRDLRRNRRSDARDPAARRHRGRLGRALARHVGAGPRRHGLPRARCRRSTPESMVSSIGCGPPARPMRSTSSPASTRSSTSTGVVRRTSTTSSRCRGRSSRGSRSSRSTSCAGPTNRSHRRAATTASVAERDSILATLRPQLAGEPETAGMFEAALRSSSIFLSGRERAKTNCVMVINEMRVALREFGRRLVERGVIDEIEQLFMVTDAEIDHLRHRSRPVPRRHPPAMGAVSGALFDYEPVFNVNHRAAGTVGDDPARPQVGGAGRSGIRSQRHSRFWWRRHREGAGDPRCR